MHPTLVVVHALAALTAAAAGGAGLARPRLAEVYLAALVVSGAALAGLATVAPSPGMRVVDLALLGLFAVVVARAGLAVSVPASRRRTSPRFLTGLGFGLIALADGFAIVGALDLGAPVWVVVLAAVAVVAVGQVGLARLLRRRACEERRGVGTATAATL